MLMNTYNDQDRNRVAEDFVKLVLMIATVVVSVALAAFLLGGTE